MGRALAVSKLSEIKSAMGKLNKDIKKQGQLVQDEIKQMLDKHTPEPLETKIVDQLKKKTTEVMAQMPKINELEKALEVQDEDAELAMIKKEMEKTVQ